MVSFIFSYCNHNPSQTSDQRRYEVLNIEHERVKAQLRKEREAAEKVKQLEHIF